MEREFDYVIVGSGFGGSVSAMRLTEKGYSVAVLEAGKRFREEDFPKTNWNLKRYVFMPKMGLKGIMRYTFLSHAMIVSGAGVGGGSLVYANTLYQPGDKFFKQGSWAKMKNWKQALEPHYQTAKRMMGVVTSPFEGPLDRTMKEVAEDMGKGDTYRRTPVGIYFGKAGQTVPDPYFDGEGPERTGCTLCGGCMIGCHVGAKNTMPKNYLYFAEKQGAEVFPERVATDIRPLPGGGYEVETEKSGAWVRKQKQTFTARRGVIVSAGVLGTLRLLAACKMRGSLPNISDRLGHRVCTNSESMLGVSAKNDDVDYSKGIAISASIFPDEDTHLEVVRFPKGSDLNGMLAGYLTGGGNPLLRPFKYVGNAFRHPIDFARTLWPLGWARRSSIILAMQSVENYIRLVPKKFGKGVRLTSQPEDNKAQQSPTYIPIANEVTKKIAEKIDGVPQSSLIEIMFNAPATAHILGGAGIGSSPETGVIDDRNQVYGHENLYVCDGSMIPSNLGVNPSLTIMALTEHAMSQIPAKSTQPAQAEAPVIVSV